MDYNESLNIYYGKRDDFYFVSITNKLISRDNKISELFGEEMTMMYHSPSITTDKIYLAKFWKDKDSAIRFINSHSHRGSYTLHSLDRDGFINAIPEKDYAGLDAVNQHYLKNLELKRQEQKYSKVWEEYRKNYKAISAYKKVKDPQWWLPCKDCGLIPLVWEFNNGRSTACGCGENEYNHHSIHAESIMSFVTRNNGSAMGYNSDELRMNWNQWVKTGQDVFKQMKEQNPKIW
jgi:hypothetical protein